MSAPDEKFLGRVYVEDARDKNFLMSRKIGEATTTPTGKRLWSSPVQYDQGQQPACTGFSTSGALSDIYAAQQSGAIVMFDALRLYQWANTHDGIPGAHEGSTVRAAFQGLIRIGDQIIHSNYKGDSVGVFERVKNYLWADVSKVDADINNLINWILTISPVVIGINWYNDMFTPDAKGFIHPNGSLAGGHAICIRGVNATDPNNTYFVLKNSWGSGWGVTVHNDFTVDAKTTGGDCLLSKEDLVKLLKENGEAGALVDNVNLYYPPVRTSKMSSLINWIKNLIHR